MYSKEFVFVLLLHFYSIVAREIVVDTDQGRVKGSQETSYNGTKYFAFHTVRYAKAPVGKLRFQAPVPADPWNDVYDATTANGAICYQVTFDIANETEDCLFLSVYSPDPWAKKPLPVVFHIHGGGFYYGWADIYRPGYFMDSAKVVVVNINYRLGPFGFFSTGDGVIPGNAGLKDQLLALKWVRKNIRAFGGDPGKITLMGDSAGANSVDYHILSSQSTGLFRAAVLMSGTAINSLPCSRDQTGITYDTAKLIGPEFNNVKNSSELLTNLQKVDPRKIDAASKSYKDFFDEHRIVKLAELQVAYYAPVLETHNNEPFVTKCPYDSFRNGDYNKVPVLLGTVEEEGLIVMLDNYLWMLEEFDKNNSLLVPPAMAIKDPNKLQTVGERIKQEYSPNSPFQNNHTGAVKFYTDEGFQMAIMTRAFLGAPKTPVYMYVFTYDKGPKTSFHVTIPGAGNVMHSEDFGFAWQFDDYVNFTRQDDLTKDRMITLLTNFATHLDPTPRKDNLLQNVKWPKIKTHNIQYLDIGSDLVVKKDYKKEKYQFWKDLFRTYASKNI